MFAITGELWMHSDHRSGPKPKSLWTTHTSSSAHQIPKNSSHRFHGAGSGGQVEMGMFAIGPELVGASEKLSHHHAGTDSITREPGNAVRTRMVVREFLRRTDQFRAYRKHPHLNLPTTTGTVEAMGRILRDLMRRTRSVRSPKALRLWATAMIRMHPELTCNGKHFQPNLFL